MAQKLENIIVDFLKNRPGEKYKASEIARHAIDEYPEWFAFLKQGAKRNMSDGQWQNDIAGKVNTKILHTPGFSARYPQIKSIGKRPRLFYWDEGVATSIPVEVPQGPTLSQAQGLRDIVVNFLRNRPGEKFEVGEIARWAIDNHTEWFEERKEKARRKGVERTDEKWESRIGSEIHSIYYSYSKLQHPHFKRTDKRPYRYYWDEEGVSTDSPPPPPPPPPSRDLKEHDLYPLLTKYLASIGVYSLRIDEKKSSNKQGPEGNKWLYPDLVGMEDLTKDWDTGIKDIVNAIGGERAKLWSLEVKRLLNRSNVREAFFQTISNSSWAHLSYLVAADIDDAKGLPVMKELRMLSDSHGIGVIKLNAHDPKDSKILIPAHERGVDWPTCSRLAEENKDFQRYIQYVNEFYKVGYVNSANWDKPPEDDEDR